jgi:hypothetical protein
MKRRGIRLPWANLALLVFLVLQLVTGLVGLLGTTDPFRVLFWLHAVGAYGIVCLLFAKGTIIAHALRRRPGVTQVRVMLAFMLVLLGTVLVTGFVWITAGSRYVLGISLINLHAYVAILLVALLIWHVVDRWWIVRVPAARDRAAFLRLAGLAVAGLALWQVERAVQALLDTPGSRRRFTGSYERGSFTGTFPAVSWVNDDPDPIDVGSWRLVVDGEVERRLEFSYEELRGLVRSTVVATIDCTGGWYSTQEWSGMPLARLLDEAGVRAGAKSVEATSVTGYGRRFSLEDAHRLTLALECAGRPLAHGHGFPARLVVPGERGFDWVKWVTRVSVLDSSHLLQSPLPLS